MSFTTKKFRSYQEMEHYLNGGITGGVELTGGIGGLIGETLTFTQPAFTVTFIAVAGRPAGVLMGPDIVAQINAASALIKARFLDNRLSLVEATPTQGVALDPVASEVARARLGLPLTGTCKGRIVKQMQSAAAPRVETAQFLHDGTCAVLIWEGN